MALAIAGDKQTGTATAGPILYNDIPVVSGANLANKAHAVNITLISGKKQGSLVINGTTNELMVAAGSTDVATWGTTAQNTAVITPA